MRDKSQIEAITLDFFNTLVFHRNGRGRGGLLIEYLQAHGFSPIPWEHSILYDVFELHDEAYSPVAPQQEKNEYYRRLASRVFEGLGIPGSGDAERQHAQALWHILGPDRFDVFPDVRDALGDLRARGIRLAVVSNWQRGLRHFCHELGLADLLDQVLPSAEVGAAKPDPRIFGEACNRLGVAPARALHVGDTVAEDYQGARAAGLQVVLLDRAGGAEPVHRVIHSLSELPSLVS